MQIDGATTQIRVCMLVVINHQIVPMPVLFEVDQPQCGIPIDGFLPHLEFAEALVQMAAVLVDQLEEVAVLAGLVCENRF